MRTVISCALGECVHVAGVNSFLRLAERAGWRTIFLGPAVSADQIIEIAKRENADLVAVSYRLTPDNGERLLAEFAESADSLKDKGVSFIFGGTSPVVERAKKLNFFDACFDGLSTPEQILTFLNAGPDAKIGLDTAPQNVIDRIKWKAPYPLFRHHYGQPSLPETIQGVQQIAEAGVLDVISLGIDQDAQENFFHPERQNPRKKGAGGVPVRSKEDYAALYQASRSGNFPLLRTYSGTDDFIQLAEMYVETINIAWPAVPLFWFNQLDGRGPIGLQESILQHQQLIKWYGDRDIPVELNEPHHWGMRDAPDVVFVVSAYLAAYNAKEMGVKDYIAQLMFNSPPGTADAMDLAKMLAILEMISELETPDFRIWRQTRTGLLSYPVDEDFARGHLASSVYLQMALKPHIIHAVGYTEADHAVNADELIESCKIARRAAENAVFGQPDMTADPAVQERKNELIREAGTTLQAIKNINQDSSIDPLINPGTLNAAVIDGILDAPQLKNSRIASGRIQTRIDSRGACLCIDPDSKAFINENIRLKAFL